MKARGRAWNLAIVIGCTLVITGGTWLGLKLFYKQDNPFGDTTCTGCELQNRPTSASALKDDTILSEVSKSPSPSTQSTRLNTQSDTTVFRSTRTSLSAGTLPHEEDIAFIKTSDAPQQAKALALFGLLKAEPEEALSSTAEQAVALTSDADYNSMARALIVNPNTHGSVLGVLFADLAQRPESIALPTLFQIAQTPAHPFAATARDNLALTLGSDFGEDWAAWNGAVQKRLQSP